MLQKFFVILCRIFVKNCVNIFIVSPSFGPSEIRKICQIFLLPSFSANRKIETRGCLNSQQIIINDTKILLRVAENYFYTLQLSDCVWCWWRCSDHWLWQHWGHISLNRGQPTRCTPELQIKAHEPLACKAMFRKFFLNGDVLSTWSVVVVVLCCSHPVSPDNIHETKDLTWHESMNHLTVEIPEDKMFISFYWFFDP